MSSTHFALVSTSNEKTVSLEAAQMLRFLPSLTIFKQAVLDGYDKALKIGSLQHPLLFRPVRLGGFQYMPVQHKTGEGSFENFLFFYLARNGNLFLFSLALHHFRLGKNGFTDLHGFQELHIGSA